MPHVAFCYLRRTAKDIFSSLLVGLFVCVFICLLETLRKMHEHIFMKLLWQVSERDPRYNLEHSFLLIFGMLRLTAWTQGGIRASLQH